MATSISYKTSSEYIREMQFDYIETYSFQRNEEYKARQKREVAEYSKLQNIRRRRKLNTDEEKALTQLNNVGYTKYLFDINGEFDPSSEKTYTFRKTDSEIERLITILKIEAIDIPYWMCAPIYRDAIVFYDSIGNVVSTLNVCLSCQYMATNMFSQINSDLKTYDLLKQFFVELGHAVE